MGRPPTSNLGAVSPVPPRSPPLSHRFGQGVVGVAGGREILHIILYMQEVCSKLVTFEET